MVILKRARILFMASLAIISSAVPLLNSSPALAVTYSPFCTSQACRAAADREAAAQAKADELSSAANSLQGQVDLLNAQIASLEAEIATNEATANDLATKIRENEEALNRQQTALAKLVVEIHFQRNSDPILILAGSDSISDLAEKEAREETVKEQISASAQKIREVKAELEREKAGVDALLASQNEKRNEIAAKRNEQARIMNDYKDNASAYSADAEEARKIKAEEINKAIRAANNFGNVVTGANGNSYPYQNQCPGANLSFLAYGGYVCQCTSYAGWKVYETYGVRISSWGNANNWGNSASAYGYRVDNNPAPGTVAYSTSGPYGHVMWVESVNGGTITLSEYNWVYGDFSRRSGVPASAYRYIHFD